MSEGDVVEGLIGETDDTVVNHQGIESPIRDDESEEKLIDGAIDKAISTIRQKESVQGLVDDEVSALGNSTETLNSSSVPDQTFDAIDKHSSGSTSSNQSSVSNSEGLPSVNEREDDAAVASREGLDSNVETAPDNDTGHDKAEPNFHATTEASLPLMSGDKNAARPKQSARQAAPGLFLPPSVDNMSEFCQHENESYDTASKPAMTESSRSLFFDDDDQDLEGSDNGGDASKGALNTEDAKSPNVEDEYYDDPLMGRVKRPAHITASDSDEPEFDTTSALSANSSTCDKFTSTLRETIEEARTDANKDNPKVQPLRAIRNRTKSETMNDLFSGEMASETQSETLKDSLFNDSDSSQDTTDASPILSPTIATESSSNSQLCDASQEDSSRDDALADPILDIDHSSDNKNVASAAESGDQGGNCQRSADDNVGDGNGVKDVSVRESKIVTTDSSASFSDSIDKGAHSGEMDGESPADLTTETSDERINPVNNHTSSDDAEQSSCGPVTFLEFNPDLSTDTSKDEAASTCTSQPTTAKQTVANIQDCVSMEDGGRTSNDDSLYTSASASLSSAGVPNDSTTNGTEPSANDKETASGIASNDVGPITSETFPEANNDARECAPKIKERKKVFSFSIDENSDEDLFAAEPVVHKPRKHKSPIKPVRQTPAPVIVPTPPVPTEIEEPKEPPKSVGLFDSDGDAEDSDLFTPVCDSRNKIAPRSPAVWRTSSRLPAEDKACDSETDETAPKLTDQSVSSAEDSVSESDTKVTENKDTAEFDSRSEQNIERELSDPKPRTLSLQKANITDIGLVSNSSTVGEGRPVETDTSTDGDDMTAKIDIQSQKVANIEVVENTPARNEPTDDKSEAKGAGANSIRNTSESGTRSSMEAHSDDRNSEIPTNNRPVIFETQPIAHSPLANLQVGRMLSVNSGVGPCSDAINLFDDDASDEENGAEKGPTRSKAKTLAFGLYNDRAETDEEDGLFGPSSASKLVSREGNGGSLFGSQKKLKQKLSIFGAEKIRKKGAISGAIGSDAIADGDADEFVVTSSVKKPPARERFVSLNPLGVGTKKYDPNTVATDVNSSSKMRGGRSRNKESNMLGQNDANVANIFAQAQEDTAPVESAQTDGRNTAAASVFSSKSARTTSATSRRSPQEGKLSPKQSTTSKIVPNAHAKTSTSRRTKSSSTSDRVVDSSRSAASLGLFSEKPGKMIGTKESSSKAFAVSKPAAIDDLDGSASDVGGIFDTPSSHFTSSALRKKVPQSLFGDIEREEDGFDTITRTLAKESDRRQKSQGRTKKSARSMFDDSDDELTEVLARDDKRDIFSEPPKQNKMRVARSRKDKGVYSGKDSSHTGSLEGEDSGSETDELFSAIPNAGRKSINGNRKTGWEVKKNPVVSTTQRGPSSNTTVGMFGSDEEETGSDGTFQSSGIPDRKLRSVNISFQTGVTKGHATIVCEGRIVEGITTPSIRSDIDIEPVAIDTLENSGSSTSIKDAGASSTSTPIIAGDSSNGPNVTGHKSLKSYAALNKEAIADESSGDLIENAGESAETLIGESASRSAEVWSAMDRSSANVTRKSENVPIEVKGASANIEPTVSSVSSKKIHIRPVISNVASSGLFGDDGSDEADDFGLSATQSAKPKKSAMMESIMESNLGINKANSLFEGDDDLFSEDVSRKIMGNLISPGKKDKRKGSKPRQASDSLFGLDDSQDDTQFSVASTRATKDKARKKKGGAERTLTWGASDSEDETDGFGQNHDKSSEHSKGKSGKTLFENDDGGGDADASDQLDTLKAYKRRSPKGPALTQPQSTSSKSPRTHVVPPIAGVLNMSKSPSSVESSRTPSQPFSPPTVPVVQPQDEPKVKSNDGQECASPELPPPLPPASPDSAKPKVEPRTETKLEATKDNSSPPESKSTFIAHTPSASPPPFLEEYTPEASPDRLSPVNSFVTPRIKEPSAASPPTLPLPLDDTFLEVNYHTQTENIFKECPPPLPDFESNGVASDSDLDVDNLRSPNPPRKPSPTLAAEKGIEANQRALVPADAPEIERDVLPSPLPELDTTAVTPPLFDSITSFDGVFKVAPPPLERFATPSPVPPPMKKNGNDELERDVPVPPPLVDDIERPNGSTSKGIANASRADGGPVIPNPDDDREYFLAGLNNEENSVFQHDFSQNRVPQNVTPKTYANIFTSVEGNSDIF
ncbi:hypothetical protein SARC_06300 [Sphaeroforma arctica JP610]|uniref:Uncharacterized protein n=1 Tax=Sphaeroforma arctica JP610 TaxID=667725 RepID=A0A0L0FX03_9EUKA|nr:hypothetical protein SARC_06300 [Sphaeroforma arctica JP610]KNC81375.1 hypothetical protein SARC_06300 [Sphaeroforma arctica JP610]|eukprot:XP_014155277.1 hypothetical protein SARC_06300 [Sphaeroforma arctica JP610]